ncbi:MAG: RNA pseudouridine synthase [Flavobacteriaceae bacterium]|nr:RNA pseudouridine synthase [Flavobacteriaceae bacterium]
MEKNQISDKFDEIFQEDELYEHFHFLVDSGQNPLRVDKFLMNRIENATRNKIQKAAKTGNIIVNDKIVKCNYKVKKGDTIKILFSHPPHENLLIPEDIKIEIIYEDNEILVVNKKAGMVVHPGHGNYSGTLLNGLINYFNKLPMNSDNRPGLVHRIDKDTSGLLVIAKTEESMISLTQQFHDKISSRKYLALVWGDVKNENGKIEGNIGRSLKNRLQMGVFPDGDYGKKAITKYKVIERLGYVTLIECELETGRTHQIRVHLKHIGHTLFNDIRYGGNMILKGTTFSKYKQFVNNCFSILPGQALHAKTLGFRHPKSDKWLEFDSDLPDEFAKLLSKWKNYAVHKKK